MLDSPYFFFELMAFISCLVFYKKLGANFKWLLPYLGFVIIYELANIYNLLIWHNSNGWCNNLEGILELVLYGNFIISFDKRIAYKKRALRVVLIGVLLSFVDIFFITGFWKLASMASAVQSTILVCLVCIYFNRLMKGDDEDLNLLRHPPFLAATAVLFYSLANFFFYTTFGYMVYKNNYQFYLLDLVIPNISSLILYSLLTYSFICFSKTNRSSY